MIGVTDSDEVFKIGKELVGPLMLEWAMNVDRLVADHCDERGAQILFVGAGGHRAKIAYHCYRAARGLPQRTNVDHLWLSDISVGKAALLSVSDSAVHVIEQTLCGAKLDDIFRFAFANLRHGITLEEFEYLHSLEPSLFFDWMSRGSHSAIQVSLYLEVIASDFRRYVDPYISTTKKIVLVNVGETAFIQGLMRAIYPASDFIGLYPFENDRTCFGWENPDKSIGLLSDVQAKVYLDQNIDIKSCGWLFYSSLVPEAATLLEIPHGTYHTGELSTISSIVDDNTESIGACLFAGSVDFLKEASSAGFSLNYCKLAARSQSLWQLVHRPSRREALALGSLRRRTAPHHAELLGLLRWEKQGSVEQRLQRSSWPEGQLSIECASDRRRYKALVTSFVDKLPSAEGRQAPRSVIIYKEETHSAQETLVGVITRSKDRPLLLERAARSISSQSFDRLHWVIVNDGGCSDTIRDIVYASNINPKKVTLITNTQSLGMEAASNIGINAVNSEFIAIHDDDDSWEPGFLEKTVRFLGADMNRGFGGVVTQIRQIEESISGTRIIYNSSEESIFPEGIQTNRIAAGNMFPPISFLYRRAIWSDIGGYNENLPVLGDWLFNLEFLLENDIAVLNETLANYHIRRQGSGLGGADEYGNTVTTGYSKHVRYNSVVRNLFCRKYPDSFITKAIVSNAAIV